MNVLAHKELRIGAAIELPKGEEGIWTMIQKLDPLGTWTIRDVARMVGCIPTQAHNYIVRLERCGYVERVGKTPGREGGVLFRRTARQSVRGAPRIAQNGKELGELQIETIWRTIRMLKRFTVPELAAFASTDERNVPVTTVQVYVSALLRAEIIIRDGKREHQRAHHHYRLLRSIGPRAPRILTANIVFDPNSKKTLGVAETTEAVS